METADKRPKRSTIHKRLSRVLQTIVVLGLALSVYEQQWLNTATIIGILVLTVLPEVLGRRLNVHIPAEFELLAIAFIFAALFLGEARGYYGRYWWWDIALHTTSGGLLGILGVLLVYVLNETPRVDVHMRPGFIAFFAFCFALTVGALWEVFEFTMDRTVGTTMQKPMRGDDSGLTDTMWDLIVDSIGAGTVSIASYFYMRHGKAFFIERWIRQFVDRNPRLFQRQQ